MLACPLGCHQSFHDPDAPLIEEPLGSTAHGDDALRSELYHALASPARRHCACRTTQQANLIVAPGQHQRDACGFLCTSQTSSVCVMSLAHRFHSALSAQGLITEASTDCSSSTDHTADSGFHERPELNRRGCPSAGPTTAGRHHLHPISLQLWRRLAMHKPVMTVIRVRTQPNCQAGLRSARVN